MNVWLKSRTISKAKKLQKRKKEKKERCHRKRERNKTTKCSWRNHTESRIKLKTEGETSLEFCD